MHFYAFICIFMYFYAFYAFICMHLKKNYAFLCFFCRIYAPLLQNFLSRFTLKASSADFITFRMYDTDNSYNWEPWNLCYLTRVTVNSTCNSCDVFATRCSTCASRKEDTLGFSVQTEPFSANSTLSAIGGNSHKLIWSSNVSLLSATTMTLTCRYFLHLIGSQMWNVFFQM